MRWRTGARCGGILVLFVDMARADVAYELSYDLKRPESVAVTLRLDQPAKAPIAFIVPRTYPGGYAEVRYDDFVEALDAKGASGTLKVEKDPDGPRWLVGRPGDAIATLSYSVAVSRMEQALTDAVSSSKLRNGYGGILGYSVFGYLEGRDSDRVRLKVTAPPEWPVLITLNPRMPPPNGLAQGNAVDYYELADAQILMGPKLRISEHPGKIVLFSAVYAEAPVDAALEAKLGREALDRVQAYFGDVPFPCYTVGLELLKPLDSRHQYGFSQEHVASGSFTLPVERAISAASSEAQLERTEFNFAHHMAHSWIPKRAYGAGYRPFNWEMAPGMDTIWFNEGFGRYAAIQAMAAGMPAAAASAFRAAQLATLRKIVDTAPAFIRRMPLEMLSREASFLYAGDFRTGSNVFARGALMAAEMDDRIQSQSHGSKSLRDALRWLLDWSEIHHAPFETADLPGYFAAATGVDVADILKRWQQPLEP